MSERRTDDPESLSRELEQGIAEASDPVNASAVQGGRAVTTLRSRWLHRRCAVCGKPQNEAFRPFCSKRCADIDLGRWLKGNYVIPGREVDEGDGATPQEAPPPD